MAAKRTVKCYRCGRPGNNKDEPCEKESRFWANLAKAIRLINYESWMY